MSPTYTMSAHLCKQIYKSFQTRQTPAESANNSSTTTTYMLPYTRRSPSPEKRSMDSDRSDDTSPGAHPTSRPSSSPSWQWGYR
ncbi:hypothetical protein F4779DRAFT_567548 [Xylariaceae sp. FL0662B]|nr:hypothetical protein F4779DRAFT_567548 [Xylariaceae sp. FL0662B]